MAEKTVIYSKRTGESPVPVTVRIEWLPGGKIIPLMYWMPDGSCYKIKLPCVCTPLAFLKDRGVGLRFQVKAELIESPEYDDELLHSISETYLYLADNWFCGKNIIDERYGHAGKEFVSVTLDVFPNCEYEIVYFKVKGTRYMVERPAIKEPRGSFHAGGVGIWHKVEARHINENDDEDPDPSKSVCRMAALYFEINKWFVTIKAT